MARTTQMNKVIPFTNVFLILQFSPLKGLRVFSALLASNMPISIFTLYGWTKMIVQPRVYRSICGLSKVGMIFSHHKLAFASDRTKSPFLKGVRAVRVGPVNSFLAYNTGFGVLIIKFRAYSFNHRYMVA